MTHHFPYKSFAPLEIPESNIAGFYTLPETPASVEDSAIIKNALASPLGTGRLTDEIQPGMCVTITVDDNSRDTRTEVMLPIVLDELNTAGIEPAAIKIFIALGTHRRMTREEMEMKYTAETVRNYNFINPGWKDKSAYVMIGNSVQGFPMKIHREILGADYLIGIGQAIPHMIAGFGGGGKIINPGCADADTIGEMHWLCHKASADGLFAVRDNAVRKVIDEIALKVGLKFILNEVPAGNGRLAGAFAGHPVVAHRVACNFAEKVYRVKIREKSDIVIADAYPADIDFWQALKGLNAACGAVKDGGTIILVTPCPEGASAQHPELMTLGYIPVEKIKAMVAREKLDKCLAANLFLGRRLIDRARVILVTEGISEKDTCAMGFDWAPDPASALKKVLARHGQAARINVLYKSAKMICRLET